MSNRYTYEDISNAFSDEGYKLLSKEYRNTHEKLEYICPNGHRHNVEWSSWKYHNRRCPYCSGYYIHIDKVRASFEKEYYTLLSNDFPLGPGRKTTKKLLYECDLSHRHYTTWSLWNMGYRCPTCKAISQAVRMSGEGNYQWNGGCLDNNYCDIWADKEYKKSFKERDGYECQNPDCWGTSDRLIVHHIDYNKKTAILVI